MHHLHLLQLLLLLLLCLSTPGHPQPPLAFEAANDAVSLLSFKAKADLDNNLHFSLHEPFDYCQWRGVKCQQSRVVRLALSGFSLRGTFPPATLSRLDQLRVLLLRNNSLSGHLPPDLSRLTNLRSLLLDHNSFSGPFPSSLLSLYKLRVLDLSFNNFSAALPASILRLDRLVSLHLQFNRFNGTLPPLNQTALLHFNVSGNNFTGKIPHTHTLSQFPSSSFQFNPNLCGEVINTPCHSRSPFFDTSSTTNQPNPARSPPSSTASFLSPPVRPPPNKRRALAIGLSLSAAFLTSSFLCIAVATRNRRRRRENGGGDESAEAADEAARGGAAAAVGSSPAGGEVMPEVIRVRLDSQGKELKEKCRELGEGRREKSGNLVFCVGEVKLYSLEQLMRASAEMLGRGTMGTTYKAKLDNQLIVTVKRLDAMKMAGVNGEMFESHMETVGALRHPNLVPVRAFFQAREERLIIFDYQPNGSVFTLIHGSRSTRAKPLHWTSCLKIAEDVAQGLAYIHQASKLIHGNLKASNVLLGTDFEACVTDHCLATLAPSSDDEDPDSARYRGPEVRNTGQRATPKSDVYAFGILLLELVSGKPPSQHPFLAPPDMPDWVKAMRGDSDSFEDNQLGMLVEVATLCSLTSPEQRPTMWHVLKMIHRIKATVGSDEAVDPSTGFS